MTDNLTKEQRRKNMRAIKARSKLEDMVASELWKRGIRYRRNNKSLFGKPDISIKKYKIVIFIDSCFWHCCPIHGNMPKSNIDYWKRKLNRNIERDKEVTSFYKQKGWSILRIWEHEVKKDFDLAIEKIINTIKYAKEDRTNRF
jgi:DNA mismatch endonuclease, patch repair protein